MITNHGRQFVRNSMVGQSDKPSVIALGVGSQALSADLVYLSNEVSGTRKVFTTFAGSDYEVYVSGMFYSVPLSGYSISEFGVFPNTKTGWSSTPAGVSGINLVGGSPWSIYGFSGVQCDGNTEVYINVRYKLY